MGNQNIHGRLRVIILYFARERVDYDCGLDAGGFNNETIGSVRSQMSFTTRVRVDQTIVVRETVCSNIVNSRSITNRFCG